MYILPQPPAHSHLTPYTLTRFVISPREHEQLLLRSLYQRKSSKLVLDVQVADQSRGGHRYMYSVSICDCDQEQKFTEIRGSGRGKTRAPLYTNKKSSDQCSYAARSSDQEALL